MATIFMIPRGAPNEDDHVVLSVGGRDYKIYKGVEYVVREKGEWVFPTKIGGRSFNIPHCSVCGGVPCGVDENTNFCPNCGADMRAEEQNRAREGENDG